MELTPRLMAQHEMALARDQLTARERLYVTSRLEGSPPAVAARIAGLDDHTKLETSARIREAVRTAARSARHARRIRREDVVAGLLDAVHLAANATELVSAWREIGRIEGLYEPQRVRVDLSRDAELGTMSDAELIELSGADYSVVDLEPSREP